MATRTKQATAPWACQSKEQTADAIRALGDAQRELARIGAEVKVFHTRAIIENKRFSYDGARLALPNNRNTGHTAHARPP